MGEIFAEHRKLVKLNCPVCRTELYSWIGYTVSTCPRCHSQIEAETEDDGSYYLKVQPKNCSA